MLSLAGGLPEPSTFPVELLAEAARRQVLEHRDVLQYAPTEGDPRLREHIAAYESVRQSRLVDPDHVLVTTGSQQALAMAAGVVADAGDTIAVPHPCYLGALQTFGAAGLVIHPVGTRDGQLDLDHLEAELVGGLSIPAMYVVANHGNPDGTRLNDATNRRLAVLAERFGFWLLEDDPYRELWFDDAPVAALGSHTANVLSLGSFSKTIAPGLRVGWIVAEGDARGALVRLKQAADLHTPALSQALIADLLDNRGWFVSHTDSLRALYASRRDAMADALHTTFGSRFHFTPPTGGMFAWGELEDVDTSALLAGALAQGVCFVPGAEFEAGGPSLGSWLRLSYATLSADQLHEGVRRVAAAVELLDADRESLVATS
ncbi:MAG: lysN 1 [Ilumatobacteraceae bacterium]|nr:lysN 1 [Ilumatobacteraceae bacterium]MCU1386876.1 lysN 1 [Ilumatobacteraceae bacterium]